jgi:hypothetical protein
VPVDWRQEMKTARTKSTTRYLVAAALLVCVSSCGVRGGRSMAAAAGKGAAERVETKGSLSGSGTIKGGDFLGKSLLSKGRMFGHVTDIRYGQLDPHPGNELCVAGMGLVVFIDNEGKAFGNLELEKYGKGMRMVDVEGDGVCEYLMWSPVGGRTCALRDHKGRLVWDSEGIVDFVQGLGYGDLDEDGKLDFIIFSYPELVALDSQGRQL